MSTEYVAIKDIGAHANETVTLRGWLYNIRSSGKIAFLQLRDGSGMIQGVVVKAEVAEATWDTAKGLTQESSVLVTGSVRQDDRAPYCGYEHTVTDVQAVQIAEPNYPISHKEHGPDFLLENRHLWLRTPKQAALLRIRHEVMKAATTYLDDRDFLRIDAPIFTPSACEGTTTLFEVDYFDDKAFLSQSGQLYMEAAAMALGKVYCLGPAFRAEKSKTRRHLTEFWMIEPEIAFLTFEENLQLQEGMVTHIVEQVLKNRMADLKTLERDIAPLLNVKAPFPRVSYDEAIEKLQSLGHDIAWGSDFGAPDETVLTKLYDRPIFVHRFPAKIKAFYMAPDPERPEVALGADMLAPGGYGEIIGGGQRVDDADLLRQRIQDHNLPEEAFAWFMDLRKYGSVPHGGFGMGIERCVAWIAGIEHVRETSPFPRTIYRIYP
ncbi:MAG: asparagine--tRNA ligase [Candidatus Sericytochromatia bacterium]|nr:asparagine--tRNA ligase [Candidatus Sericytochromatia bacterium]